MNQKLLVSVRGPNEALTAVRGGAKIADIEYPASALGTPYPLNILSVKEYLDREVDFDVQISTNIGEIQTNRSTSCQAALGVATAGAELIKFGLANLNLEAAVYLGKSIVRTVRNWYPEKRLIPAVFVDQEFREIFDPFKEGPKLVQEIDSDGLLLDTFDKRSGKGLVDLCNLDEISELTRSLHSLDAESWIAGSIGLEEIGSFWETKVDVICVRGAACIPLAGNERFGEIDIDLVKELVGTIPST